MGMELRSGHVVGAHLLPPQARPLFEEGARHLFARWTALCLAIENQWGGQTSAEKGQWLLQESIQWFYKNKGGWLFLAVAGRPTL
jgi:pre-rRNA-processing protein TSR2